MKKSIFPEFETSIPVTADLGDKEIACVLKEYSAKSAYLEVAPGNSHQLSERDLGKEVLFSSKNPMLGSVIRKAKISRAYDKKHTFENKTKTVFEVDLFD